MTITTSIAYGILFITGLATLHGADPTKIRPSKIGFGKICIQKFDDKNRNGVQDQGEVGLAGWTFTVNPGGMTVTTGPGGKVCFARPAPRSYSITELPKAGWMSVGPAAQNFILSPNSFVVVTFGNARK